MDGESEAQREERLQSLWRQLDTRRKGYLDLQALKTGLAQMNHRKLCLPLQCFPRNRLGISA